MLLGSAFKALLFVGDKEMVSALAGLSLDGAELLPLVVTFGEGLGMPMGAQRFKSCPLFGILFMEG